MILSKNKTDKINPDEIINERLSDGKMESLLIIVPTNRKVRHIKRELISVSPGKMTSSLKIETIGTFASKILFGGFPETELLSEEAAIILLKQCFAEVSLQYFSQYKSGLPFGTLQRIRNVISEYKRQGILPDQLFAESKKLIGIEKRKAEDISKVFSLYQEKLKELNVKETGDVYSGINNLSTDNFRQAFKNSFENVDTILINGFDEFTSPEISIINSAAGLENISLYVVFDYFRFNPVIFSHLDKCYSKFLASGFNEIKDSSIQVLPQFRGEIREKLFLKENKGKNDYFRDKINVIVAKNREEEVELILKEIKTLLLQNKIKPEQVCVVFNLIEKNSPVIRDRFSKYGIPLNLTDRFSLSTSEVIISIINFLEIAENDFYFKNIFRAFSSIFIESDKIDLSIILKASVDLKIVSGFDNWMTRTENKIKEIQADEDEYYSAQKLIDQYIKAKQDITGIKKKLEPFVRKNTVEEFLTAMKDLIYRMQIPQKILKQPDAIAEKHSRALSTFLESIEEIFLLLKKEYGENEKHSLRFYLENIRTFVRSARFNVQEKPGYGVLVTTPNEIRGLQFDYLFIGGMIDGDLPTRFSPEVFFSGHFAKQEIIHQTEERYHFYQSLCSWNQQLYLSYPEFDDKKELVKSVFLRELLNSFEVSFKSAKNYNDKIFSKEEYIELLGTLDEKEIEKLVLPEEIEFSKEELIDSLKIDLLRKEKPFDESPFTGFIDFELDEKAKTELNGFADKEYSVTELEMYAKCPFKYFAERVLNLSLPEEPTEDLEAIELGSILHSILYEFYTRVTNDGVVIKNCSDADFKKVTNLIFEIAEKKFSKLILNSPSAFFESEKVLGIEGKRENSILYRFLVEERNSPEGFIPSFFEFAFGNVKNEKSNRNQNEEVKIGNVKMRGKIDRIDINDEDDSIKIIDYKLSGKLASVSDYEKGLELQLPVYLFVAKQLISAQLEKDFKASPPEIYSLKYSENDFGRKIAGVRKPRRKNVDENYYSDAADALIHTAIEAVQKYVKLISEGRFNLSELEDRENKICRYCNFRSICRIQEVG